MISYSFNPKTLPLKNQSVSFFHNGTNKNSILLVKAAERKKIEASTGTYYLCVDPIMTSTYSIVIDELPANRGYHII